MTSSSTTRRRTSSRRSTIVRVIAAAVAIALAAAGAAAWTALTVSTGASAAGAASTSRPTAASIGSVAHSTGLPPGFNKTFKDRFVQANGIRQHIVIGGEGPPLLLVHGWGENWYARRYVMPKLVTTTPRAISALAAPAPTLPAEERCGLTSPQSRRISGANLVVDGALTRGIQP